MLMLRRVLVVLAGVLVLGALGAGSAFGALSFPFDGQLALAGGSFGGLEAGSVAVDDVNGDSYVADSGSGVVDVFETSSGAQLAGLDGALTPAGSFRGGGGGETGVAVAVNNATGDVYVLDSTHSVVDVFSSLGAYVCQITGSSTPSASECNGMAGSKTPAEHFSAPGGITVDQATGDVYVVDSTNGVVDVFGAVSGGSGGGYLRQISLASIPGGFESGRMNGVAVSDFNGHVYVSDSGGTAGVFEFDGLGSYVATWTGENTKAGSFANYGYVSVAVDDASGRVFVGETKHGVADVFDSSGGYLTQLSHSFSGPRGVAVDQASGRVYVSDTDGSNTGLVDVFGPATLVPEVSTGSASEIQPANATLNGTVNPDAVQLTDCHFEYGPTASYGQSVPCVPAAGSIPADSSEHAVSAGLAGLVAGGAYHFRLVASNADGVPSFGEDATFATPPPPSIDSASAVNLTGAAADLTARVNPNGFDTTYRFEYGTSSSYSASAPMPDADIGAETTDVAISQHVAGLQANTTYHWRVVARNGNGTRTGSDHTFIYDTSGGGLPDGRAYEMVTPPGKSGGLVFTGGATVAEDGSRVSGSSIQCFASAGSCNALRTSSPNLIIGSLFVFSRGGGGWVTTPVTPPAARFEETSGLLVNADSGSALFGLPTAPFGEDDFYVSRLDGSLVDVGPVSPPPAGRGAGGSSDLDVQATADFSHVVYEAPSFTNHWPFDGTSGTSSNNLHSLFEFVDVGNAQPVLVGVSGGAGSTDLISVCGTKLGATGESYPGYYYGALSADGGTVYFTAGQCLSGGSGVNAGVPVPAPALYARIDGSRTVAVSQRSPLECTGVCASSPPSAANFVGASQDGSRVFFTDTQQLTDAASEDGHHGDTAEEEGCSLTVGVNGCNLYEYDFGNSAGRNLVAVSAGDVSGGGPRVQGVMGMSGDGSHVYFVAKGALTSVANSQGQVARNGAENLYVFERDASFPAGRVVFIASLSGENFNAEGSDSHEWINGMGVANVTPDGRFLVFTSHAALTADDTSTTGVAQVFRYDAQANELTRVSVGERGFNDNGNAGTQDASIATSQRGFGAARPPRLARLDPTMSHDGRFVFFQSPVGLTPGALDDMSIGAGLYAENVYEWHEGHVYLISDGKDTSQVTGGGSAVQLIGSDATGANVFFSTSDRLVPQDTDTAIDFYDARIGGGFPYTPPAAGCEGEACHGTPGVAPVFAAGGSATFTGAGNLTAPVVRGVVKTKKKVKAKRRKRKRRGRGRVSVKRGRASGFGKHLKRGRR
jgi:DNA-binding beta-propeller fold protein YncE